MFTYQDTNLVAIWILYFIHSNVIYFCMPYFSRYLHLWRWSFILLSNPSILYHMLFLMILHIWSIRTCYSRFLLWYHYFFYYFYCHFYLYSSLWKTVNAYVVIPKQGNLINDGLIWLACIHIDGDDFIYIRYKQTQNAHFLQVT